MSDAAPPSADSAPTPPAAATSPPLGASPRAGATRAGDASPPPWGVEGPVQAEVFVLWLNGDGVELSGPCGADAWYIELGPDDDPVDVVTRLSRGQMGEPLLVHSTSWRRHRGAVILSFVVVVDEPRAAGRASVPVGRSELARSTATAAPLAIGHGQVIEHGLRHLAWLAKDDPHVRAALSPGWHRVLSGYVPEPFRHLP